MEQLDKSYLIFLGMIAGFVSIYLGYKLFIKGIDGSATMEGEVRKIKLSLRNASPGLFFALFGTFMLLLGIYKKDIHSEEWTNQGYRSYTSKGSTNHEEFGLDRNQIENEIYNMAVRLKNNNEFSAAKYLYSILILLDPDNYRAHNNLANILLNEGNKGNNYELAVLHAEYAINSCGDDVEKSFCYETLANIFDKQENLEEAIKAIANAIKLNPQDKNLQLYLNKLQSKLK